MSQEHSYLSRNLPQPSAPLLLIHGLPDKHMLLLHLLILQVYLDLMYVSNLPSSYNHFDLLV